MIGSSLLGKMQICIMFLCTLFFAQEAQAQEASFKVSLSRDTVLMNNYFEIKFIIENAKSKNFTPPDFKDFKIVGGPSQSSNFSMINGEVTQSITYTYFLEPTDEGIFTIGTAYVDTGEERLETPRVDVVVRPNPEGIIEEPHRKQQTIEDFWNRSFDLNSPDIPGQSKPKRKEASPTKDSEPPIKTIKI
ncbi:MAG: BatD family protein [Saprospiraceae bacterium]|nr:BatD family protein [Saprospiraceae bacterium]